MSLSRTIFNIVLLKNSTWTKVTYLIEYSWLYLPQTHFPLSTPNSWVVRSTRSRAISFLHRRTGDLTRYRHSFCHNQQGSHHKLWLLRSCYRLQKHSPTIYLHGGSWTGPRCICLSKYLRSRQDIIIFWGGTRERWLCASYPSKHVCTLESNYTSQLRLLSWEVVSSDWRPQKRSLICKWILLIWRSRSAH